MTPRPTASPFTEPARVRVGFLADHCEAAPRVADWLRAEWYHRAGDSPSETAGRVRLRLNRDRLPLSLVALAGAVPVGTVSLVSDNGDCSLAGLYVEPGWRRRGVGRRLCRRAGREARHLGFDAIHLYTADAQGFYARLGWTKVAETVVECGPELVFATVMTRRLARRPVAGRKPCPG